jgi:hypothetical protein
MEVSAQLHAPPALPQERTPGIHWIGGWMFPGDGLNTVGKRKISCLCWVSIHNSLPTEPIASHHTDSIIPASLQKVVSILRLLMKQEPYTKD